MNKQVLILEAPRCLTQNSMLMTAKHVGFFWNIWAN